MFKVSVIVPVYNASAYLREMVESLLAQTLREFEAIFILDAPTDESEEILSRYQETDDRIKLVKNEKRQGAAKARNLGIELAQAQYLLFLDADDIFEKEMMEKAYHALECTGADIVLYEHDTFDTQIAYAANEEENHLQMNVFRLKDLPQDALTYWNCVVWNKMFRKDFVQKNALQFQDIPSSNDVYFVDMALMLADTITHVDTDKKLLHYRVNTGGQISASRNPVCAWEALYKVYEELHHRKLWNKFGCYYYIKFLHTMTTDLRRGKEETCKKDLYQYIATEGCYKIGLDSVEQMPFENINFAGECKKFMIEPYEHEWYKKHVVLYAQLVERRAEIIQLLDHYRKCGKSVAFWGAGPAGRAVVQFCGEYDVRLLCIIDNDRNKQGKKLGELTVEAFEKVYQEVDVVLCSNRNHMAAISEQIKKLRPTIEVVKL